MNDLSRRAGYRFDDLREARIVSSRSDLHDKQKNHGFPKPIKLSVHSAWWPSEEINAWLQARAALRDAAEDIIPDIK
jgi:predicted DNA-binding transcriptional regulator AlpA